MKDDETTDKFLKNLKKRDKNSNKLLVKFLKYLNKIEKAEQYDDYKKLIFTGIIEWIIEVIIIRPFILSLLLFCLSAVLTTPTKLFLIAEGISIFWYLLIELKQDLWRK